MKSSLRAVLVLRSRPSRTQALSGLLSHPSVAFFHQSPYKKRLRGTARRWKRRVSATSACNRARGDEPARLLLARLRQVPGAVHHLHHGNEEPALATTVNAKHCHVVFELRGITKQCAQRACTYRRPSSARAITSPSDNQCVCSRSWSRHLNASATASSAWIAVVSNNGTLVCSCCTSMTISVQPSITPSAPAAPSCSMIRRYSVLELERTSP